MYTLPGAPCSCVDPRFQYPMSGILVKQASARTCIFVRAGSAVEMLMLELEAGGGSY